MRVTPYIPGQSGTTASQQQTTLTKAINGGLELAGVTGVDSTGWANQFVPVNVLGSMVRVTGVGSTPPSGSVNWTAANTQIPHQLGRVPMGWIVTYKNKTCDIWAGSTVPDANNIYLTINDDTANVNIFVF